MNSKTIKLSDDDIAKMGMIQASESVTMTELGGLREEYLQREVALLRALEDLRAERTSLLNAMGKFYLKEEESSDGWKFRADQMAFVLEMKESKETTKDHGNSNQPQESYQR